MPPALLMLVLVRSFAYALLVWRPRQVMNWVFPGYSVHLPERAGKERRADIVAACGAVAASSFLLLNWLLGLL